MVKREYNFEELKEIMKVDFGGGIFLLITLFLVGYLFLNSKMTLAVVTIITSILTLLTYGVYFKKINEITEKNRKYYEFLGKLLYFTILSSFFVVYGTRLFRIMKWRKNISIALFYPRLALLIIIVFLLLWAFYPLKKRVLKRELFFCIISLTALYENLIFFIVNRIYGIVPTDSDIGFYLLAMFIVVICLWMIYIDANSNKIIKK